MSSGIRLEATSYVCVYIYIHMNICIFTLTLKCEYIYIYTVLYIYTVYTYLLSLYICSTNHQAGLFFSLKSCSFLSLSLNNLVMLEILRYQNSSPMSERGTHEPQKFPLYWLFNTDPYNGLL